MTKRIKKMIETLKWLLKVYTKFNFLLSLIVCYYLLLHNI